MSASPTVSVILPVYNAAPYIAEAAGSILQQTFGDFELLLINDGSTDDSLTVMRQLAQDKRVWLLDWPNRGLIATLNTALGMCRGQFVARMDADDLATLARLEKQVAFLRANPEIAVVGGWLETFGDGEKKLWPLATDPEQIQCTLLFRNAMAHPTVLMRRDLFAGPDGFRFDPDYQHVEDYDLWLRISQRHRLTNLPEVVHYYRMHAGQVSALHAEFQRQQATKAQVAQVQRTLGIAATEAERRMQHALAFDELPPTAAFLTPAYAWLTKLLAANETHQAFPPDPFARILTGRYVALARLARKNGLAFPIGGTPFDKYLHAGAL